MFIFTSIAPGYRTFGKPVKSDTNKLVPEYDVRFVRNGASGQFSTDDEELAKKLREHPQYGKAFVETNIPVPQKDNVVVGIRSSISHPDISGETVKEEVKEEIKIDTQKYIRYGVLQNKLLKNDLTYRKDASPEEITEYENLKKELGD